MKKTFAGAATALFVIATPALAQGADERVERAQENAFGLTFTTGVDYSSGDYGLEEKTRILVVPFALRGTTGPWAFTASVPYLRISGPGGVVLGPDGRPLPGVPTTEGSRSGIGDLSLGANYTVPSRSTGGIALTFGGRVKLPTSSTEDQLSTGETDYNVSLDATYEVGNVQPFVTLGYRFLGDPDGFDLRDGPTASVGSNFIFGNSVLITSYDYARSSTPAVEDSHELFAGLAVPASRMFTVTGYGIAGLSEGSPDYGVGLLLTTKLQ